MPASAQELSAKNLAAYLHYQGCKAVGHFPADETVRRNAAVIRAAEDAAERAARARTGLAVLGELVRRV